MNKALALLIAGIILFTLGLSAVAATHADFFTNPNKTLQVTQAAPTVTLKIKSNPSTGYSWFLVDYNPTLLVPVSHAFVPPIESKPGASGYELWRFSIPAAAFVVPQMTEITVQYRRPWVVSKTAESLKFTVMIEAPVNKNINQ